jgi:hypothetical protein
MPESNPVNHRLVSGFCFAVLALLFLANPFIHTVARIEGASPETIAITGFVAPFTMTLMVGAVFGMMHLLRRRADRAALIGAALVLTGWTVGCRIIALAQLQALLQTGVTGVPVDSLDKLLTAAPIVWVSIVPFGLLFPLGLITLGVTWLAFGPVHRWIGALLAIGGVLFPLGRAVRLEWAISSCDVVLGVTFALLGWQVLTRPELWRPRPA